MRPSPSGAGPFGLPYRSSGLDRATEIRRDHAAVSALVRDPELRVLPVWRGRLLRNRATGLPGPLTGSTARAALEAAPEPMLLGLDGAAPVFAADLADLSERDVVETCDASSTVDLRHVVSAMAADDAGLAAYARGVVHWSRNARFCGACGGPTGADTGGIPRRCSSATCGRIEFPRIEPAVIALVQSSGEPRRCLLARQEGAAVGSWAAIAGFVEVGESLEDAVIREVREETGVLVTRAEYVASQPWPFPAGLMIGFFATALDTRIRVDDVEVVEARWFDAEDVVEVAARCRPDSIEKHLLGRWLAAGPPRPAPGISEGRGT